MGVVPGTALRQRVDLVHRRGRWGGPSLLAPSTRWGWTATSDQSGTAGPVSQQSRGSFVLLLTVAGAGQRVTMLVDILIAIVIVVIAAILGIVVHPILWIIVIAAALWLLGRSRVRGSRARI